MDHAAKFKGNYGKSENGNFEVIDTIGVPHPYCITSKHVVHASDRFCGRLGQEAIESLEKEHGPCCGMGGCNLPYAKHEQALLVSCRVYMCKENGEVVPELHEYLLTCKDECERHNYVGFAFADHRIER